MTLSPINQKHIQTTKANNANTASVNVAPKVNTGQPQDSVELSTNKKQGLIDKIKANKKILIPAAIGIAALAGGVIYGIKTGKISFKGNIEKKASEIIDEGNKIQQRANEIIEESNIIPQKAGEIIKDAKKQYDEVLALIRKGQENGFEEFSDGSKLIKFDISDDNNINTITEWLDGKISRRADFYFKGQDYRITSIYKNFEDLGDCVKAEEKFSFNKHKALQSYLKDVAEKTDESWEASEKFTFRFTPEKLSIYSRNVKNLNDSEEATEAFRFFNNELQRYHRNIDEPKKISEEFIFDHETKKLDKYTKNKTKNKDGSIRVAKAFLFDENGELKEFYKNHKTNANCKESWAQRYTRNEQGELVKA